MSLAGAPVADPISLASAAGRALPRRVLALIADTIVLSLLDAILNGTFGITRVTSGVATTVGSGGYTSFTTQTTVDWPWLALLWVTYYTVVAGFFGATLGKRLTCLRVTDLEGAKNTSQGIVSDGVNTYTLGSPQWAIGTVTYPITYEVTRTSQACRGFITLNWNWGFAGWVFSSGESQCSPRIYP